MSDLTDVQPPEQAADPARQLWLLWRAGQRPDLGAFLAGAGPLTAAQAAAVLRVDQRERWLAGERVPAEDYLRRFRELHADADYALDLVYGEYLLREELGEAPPADDYARRFPPFASQLRLQLELRQALDSATSHDGPSTDASGDDQPGPAAPRPEGLPGPAVPGYEVAGLLGRGGMSVVYRAVQLTLKRPVALKLLRTGDAEDDEVARFRGEAEAVARLQHPHIVQIFEVGEHDGRPYLALELVEGGSLDKRLRGGPLPARAAAALAQALARAVHYAHQKGVVHRDLKPANVLLTADGIPKVTDFGLAKRLDGEAGQTQSGAVVGTPSYMAPEQAAGRTHEVGPLADVYALGAVLYEALTGRPPFQADTALDTLLMVRAEDPLPPSRLRPKLPPDLETICLKCLRKEPRKRYGSAEELADDLGRFLDGRPVLARPVRWWERGWKWVRRRPAAAGLIAVSAAALLALLVGALVSNAWLSEAWHEAESNAEQARNEGEVARANERRAYANLEQACQAVDGMLSEVGYTQLRDVPHMEPVRRRLLEKALTFYQDFIKQRSDDPVLRQRLARGHWRVGDIFQELDRNSEAEQAYRRALVLFAALETDFPGVPDHRRDVAGVNNNLATLLKNLGQGAEAERAFRQAIGRMEKLVEAFPREPDHRRELSLSEGSLANLLKGSGRAGEAERAYLRSLGQAERLAADFPRHPGGREALAEASGQLSGFRKWQGRLAEAEQAQRKTLALWEGLVQEFPSVARYQQGLARSHQALAQVLLAQKRLAEAVQAFRQSLDRRRELAARFPGMPAYRMEAAVTWSALAMTLRAADRPVEAEQAYRAALALLGPLTAEFPEVPLYRERLGISHHDLAFLLEEMHRRPEAEQDYRKAYALFKALTEQFPKTPAYQREAASTLSKLGIIQATRGQLPQAEQTLREVLSRRQKVLAAVTVGPGDRAALASDHHNLGQVLAELGRAPEAEQTFHDALALREKLVAELPDVPDFGRDLARTHSNLGALFRSTKRLPEAEAAYRKALALHEELLARFPATSARRDALANAHDSLASVLALRNRPEESVDAYRRAIALKEKLVTDAPQAPAYRHSLAATCYDLGNQYRETRRPGEAEQAYLRARDLLDRLAAEAPKAAAPRALLGAVLNNLADVVQGRGESEEACKLLKAAIGHQRAALALEPRNQLSRQHLRNHYANLTRALLELGDHAAAARAAAELPQASPRGWRENPLAAEFLTRCAALAEKDSRLAEDQRRELAQDYAGRAVDLLRQAVAKGFKDMEYLKKSSKLRALRGREDFKQLVRDLEQKPQGGDR
jgi:serine/threonine-protein kinase